MRLIILSIALSTLFFSCKKDELVEPVSSDFKVQISANAQNTDDSYEVGLKPEQSFHLNDIISLSDGNFIFAGAYHISPRGYPVLASINRSGIVNWIGSYKGLSGTIFKKIVSYQSGIITLLAIRQSAGSANSPIFTSGILTFNDSGTLLSEQYFPLLTGTNSGQFDIAQNAGNFFISVVRPENGLFNNSIYKILDVNSGTILLDDTLSNFRWNSMNINSTGIVSIVGNLVNNTSSPIEDNSLRIMDFSGTLLFSKQSSDLGGGIIMDALPLPDNSIFIAIAINDGVGTIKFVKLDNQGNIIFSIQNNNRGFTIDSDNDRFFVYSSPYQEVGDEFIYAYSLSTGELIWSKPLEGNKMIQTLKLNSAPDGGVIVSKVLNKANMNLFVVKKLDSNGN